MPNTYDSGLVVTFSQLIVLVAGQASVTDVLKCAIVRYSDMPRPASDRTQVVSWNHSGGAMGCATSTAAAFAGAAVRAGAGLPFPARAPPGRLPCRGPVVTPASGRPPRVPLSRDWVPPLPGLAVVPGLRVAITARSSRR